MDSRKKNFVIAGVIAAALTLAAGTVAAQDYFFPLFGAYVDHVVPGDSPVRTVTPTTYEETIVLYYLCEDNRVIARRFFRTNSSAQVPTPVYLVNPPDVNYSAPTPTAAATPAPAPVVCPVGFVPAVSGGCVPPDHPLATGR